MMTQSKRLDPQAQSGAVFDELLVMLVQQGDERAMERLHTRWTPRLARAALRYTGDAELARDLVQECWIGIWKGMRRLKSPDRFRSYAFAVLHRRGSDHLRGVISNRKAHADVGLDGLPDQPVDAPQGEALAIRQAFAALPPDQRLAAHLYFVEGLTVPEIAEVQSIAQGTAKSRLFHARRKLKAALTYPTKGEPQ